MEFMNEQMSTPVFMAQYTDNMMQKTLKGKDDAQVAEELDAMIRLFCCLNGRDMFLKSYEKELANRLLNKTSISNEYEEQMIQKLKVECGAT